MALITKSTLAPNVGAWSHLDIELRARALARRDEAQTPRTDFVIPLLYDNIMMHPRQGLCAIVCFARVPLYVLTPTGSLGSSISWSVPHRPPLRALLGPAA